jgi:hypothetical protein
LPDSIENPPPPKATICRGTVFTYPMVAAPRRHVVGRPSELEGAPLAPVYKDSTASRYR